MFNGGSLESELNEKIALKAINHRNRFARLFLLRNLEMLPSLIKYKGGGDTSIDFLKLEVGLMDNYNVVIAEDKAGRWRLCGYTRNNQTISDSTDFFTSRNKRVLNEQDIIFTVRRNDFPKTMKEITLQDDAKTGNFIVVRNKTLNYISDREVIDHYTIQLAEIVNSRFSLSLQAKVMTFFRGNVGDETINQIVEDLYNGSPVSKTSKLFDPKDQIFTINNANISNNMQQLKREYQNTISEMHNMIGIDSLGVSKESGVSDEEAKSGNAYTTAMANIKLTSREASFDLLRKHTNDRIIIKPIYNDQIASEMRKLAFIEEVVS